MLGAIRKGMLTNSKIGGSMLWTVNDGVTLMEYDW